MRESLIRGNTTELYRRLVDLTCAQAGKAPDDPAGTAGQLRIAGLDLRTLLWKTASAITTLGEESISHDELKLRLGEDNLSDVAESLTLENTLSALMISFYFKAGHTELGCEFLHKSFREYLHAEHIIATLKNHAAACKGESSERGYYRDFADESWHYDFSRDLSELLSPQWLTREIRQHLLALLEWEVGRSWQPSEASLETHGTSVPAISSREWEALRDALADVWEWWGDGAHLRPRVERRKGQMDIDWHPAYVHELAQHAAPSHRREKELPKPVRAETLDAHLGDGLFQLAAETHFLVARSSGWLTEPLTAEALWLDPDRQARNYQTVIQRNGLPIVLFRPSGNDPSYFRWFANRINGSGWYPDGFFPKGVSARGVDLGGTWMYCTPWDWAGFKTDWSYCNLEGCNGRANNLGLDIFRYTYAVGADFSHANVVSAVFDRADLRKSDFSNTFQDTSFATALTDGAVGLNQTARKNE